MAKKLGCASCGGTMKKMAKGGTTKSVSISKRGAGVVKETKGDTNQKMGIYGVAQTGPTGPNDSGIATMKKGGMVKKPLAKAQDGKIVGEMYKRKTPFQDYLKNNKGAVASDTLGKSVAGKPNMGYFSSANPKNEKALGKAIDKTYNKKKMGGAVKKPLMKAQSGGTKTPFQKGVANKDFKASDTSYVSKYNKNVYSGNQKVMADQAPKTTKGSKDYNKKLDSAYNKTYGSSNVASMASGKRDSEGKWPTKESEYRLKTNKSVKTKKK